MMNKREETFIEAITPSNKEDIRALSMGSIALMSKIGNKTCAALVAGEEINLEDREDILNFIWAHVADRDEVIKCCLIYQQNPFILQNKVYQFALDVTDEQLSNYIVKIINDGANIKNAESEVVPEPNQKKSRS